MIIITKYNNSASYAFPIGLTSGDRLFQAKLFSPKAMKTNSTKNNKPGKTFYHFSGIKELI